MSEPVTYIRHRAEALRNAASAPMTSPEVRSDYQSGARYLELVADELAAGFHEEDSRAGNG